MRSQRSNDFLSLIDKNNAPQKQMPMGGVARIRDLHFELADSSGPTESQPYAVAHGVGYHVTDHGRGCGNSESIHPFSSGIKGHHQVGAGAPTSG